MPACKKCQNETNSLINVLHLKSAVLTAAKLSIHALWDATPWFWMIGDFDAEGNGCFETSVATGATAQRRIPEDFNSVYIYCFKKENFSFWKVFFA